jgi:K+-transporting ATPase ATPase C chain
MKRQIFTGIKLLFVFTLLTGLFYPIIITFFAQLVYPYKALGSFKENKGLIVGSELIAQKFTGSQYFWPRPSAINYQPMPSGATNLSQTSSILKNEYDKRKTIFIHMNSLDSTSSIPKEMLFSSASGVDPHISPEAAYLQAGRIVKERYFNAEQEIKLNKLIETLIEKPQLGFLGKRIINVFILNLELDKIAQSK